MRTGIRALTIELCGIVGCREKDLQKLPIGDLSGIEGDLDRFGVARLTGAYDVLVGDKFRATRITRYNVRDALERLENSFQPPKAASSKHRGFFVVAGRRGRIGDRIRQMRHSASRGGERQGTHPRE